MDLDPGVEMQWAGGPHAFHNRGEVRNKNPERSTQTETNQTHHRTKTDKKNKKQQRIKPRVLVAASPRGPVLARQVALKFLKKKLKAEACTFEGSQGYPLYTDSSHPMAIWNRNMLPIESQDEAVYRLQSLEPSNFCQTIL